MHEGVLPIAHTRSYGALGRAERECLCHRPRAWLCLVGLFQPRWPVAQRTGSSSALDPLPALFLPRRLFQELAKVGSYEQQGVCKHFLDQVRAPPAAGWAGPGWMGVKRLAGWVLSLGLRLVPGWWTSLAAAAGPGCRRPGRSEQLGWQMGGSCVLVPVAGVPSCGETW